MRMRWRKAMQRAAEACGLCRRKVVRVPTQNPKRVPERPSCVVAEAMYGFRCRLCGSVVAIPGRHIERATCEHCEQVHQVLYEARQ
jgi:hypothetical protein